jgi:hypothetical protein
LSFRRVGLGLAVIALAILPAMIQLAEADLNKSLHAFGRRDCVGASAAAHRSLSAFGVRPEPWEVIAYCQADSGDFAAAVGAMQRAVTYDPDNWEPRYGLALVRAAAGQNPLPDLDSALQRNPREGVLQSAFRRLSHANRRPRRLEVRDLPPSIQDVAYPPITPPLHGRPAM